MKFSMNSSWKPRANSKYQQWTHFISMQLRGPLENGVTASSLSFLKRSSRSQRSGCPISSYVTRNEIAQNSNTVRGGYNKEFGV
ncbi:hypothetical protein MGG_16589 [Pyricularia oryzae 70-15]|uniref:Uncharacterized protein n=1 Tax=Pyricularia oryzae (strain 70-15 / ATCC MYA-4617 / FGSC 8958) TaxID=242507 RepID=G4MZT9_PYRO7|nr:uncharacterized protein MGG_16589 [Pyricularia oryzae 70-15]EHA51383.1 hypothetical protein MGG_16589 [Pyricularia oryzae 70-15]KAI7912749.1 hypothetical protein M9X92_009832 [Pyricularia oryzae]